MSQYRFAAYRLVEFSDASRIALKEIAARLIPHEQEIVDIWIGLQFAAWEPPKLGRDQLKQLFGDLFHGMLGFMSAGQLERAVDELELAGADLARREFPYEALVISLHFLEESYMPFIIDMPAADTREWLIRMDEFLHVAFAAIATSYFEFQRDELLQQVEVGRIVQEGLLSKIPKRLFDLDIGYVYASATERARLGGDFLDVFMLDDNKAAFIVGDLSGHGMDASADAIMVRSLFRGFMRECGDLSETMIRLNRVLVPEFDHEHFATAVACTYEPSGRLRWVRAGHSEPLICGDQCTVMGPGGPPLAIFAEPVFPQVEVELPAGSMLIAYTDGLSEARKGSDLFGDARIIEAALHVRKAPPRAVADHLLDKALRHAEGLLQDDIAILVLKRRANAMV
jgi:hypothetical protein